MNFFRVQGAVVSGIQAVPVQVECAQSRRLPFLQILGGGAASERAELRERVLAALDASGFRLPARRLTVQIRPGVPGLPLEQLDLAVAIALLGSTGRFPASRVENLLVCGRLGLDGSLLWGSGEPAVRRLLARGGFEAALAPPAEREPQRESARGGEFPSLAEVVRFLSGEPRARSVRRAVPVPAAEAAAPSPGRIWARIEGQAVGKRVIEIAAAGLHHVLFLAPPTARADLLAHGLSALLPTLGAAEQEEVRGLYALAGLAFAAPSRPFHAFGTAPALPPLQPDRRLAPVEEVLLAHHGVLYLDHAAELDPSLLAGLSGPMLRGSLSARVRQLRAELPAEVVVVAAGAGCACDAKGDPRLRCACRAAEARRFQARWRKLLRHPFDLFAELAPDRSGERETEAAWRARAGRVAVARERMRARGGAWNGRLGEAELRENLAWSPGAARLWEALDARAPDRRPALLAVTRVAATVCDLREGTELSETDLLEALHYLPAEPGGSAERASVPAMNSIAIP